MTTMSTVQAVTRNTSDEAESQGEDLTEEQTGEAEQHPQPCPVVCGEGYVIVGQHDEQADDEGHAERNPQ